MGFSPRNPLSRVGTKSELRNACQVEIRVRAFRFVSPARRVP